MVHPKSLQCKLLSGAPALLAQLLLAVIAFASLVYKRHRERPQRPYRVWTMDVSKQVFSSGAGHICGLIIALVASSSQKHATSECAWYFVAYTFDTTLGVSLAIGIHRFFVRWAVRKRQPPDPEQALEQSSWLHVIATCGDYGEPPSWRRWGVQMAEWVFSTVAARVCCGVVVVAAYKPLSRVAALLDKAFLEHTTAELFSVMICCPLLMNLVQAWIQDAVLKLKRHGAAPLPSSVDAAAAAEQLLPPTVLRSEARGPAEGLRPAAHHSSQGAGGGAYPEGCPPKWGPLQELPTLPSAMEASRLKTN